MPRPSREPQILAGALSEFAKHGYDNARVRGIAKAAGVSEAALYRHYPSKEAIAFALFRNHLRRYSEALLYMTSPTGLTVADRIHDLVVASLQAFEDERDVFVFVTTQQARLIGALPADFPYPIRIVEGIVRDGQRDGSVRDGPVRLLAALVFGCIMQPVRTVLEAPPGTISLASPEARELCADAAWRAIAATPGRLTLHDKVR